MGSWKNILLTLDIEDWFQVQNLKPFIPSSTWSSRESRVEKNTHLLLDLFDSFESQRNGHAGERCSPGVTFFVLGWVAERLPNLVRELHSRGHEVASHGISHELCNHCSPEDLRADIADSKKLLEDIIGSPVDGYRAPSFSISTEALRCLEDSGYLYDSSFNSFRGNSRYGKIEFDSNCRGIARKISDSLYELPVSNLEISRYVLPAGGGAYFRHLPFGYFSFAVNSILRSQDAYLFYLHPWEIDPRQPRIIDASFLSRLKHYRNLETTFSKLMSLLESFSGCGFVTCRDYLNRLHPKNSA